ncbi:hypothetical protein ACH47Z_46880 [Streptomyces sp. NPDC020192]|uniref:hypothetical protein n=1 Tax=Streptomyces sp. NPDC020192 TaxID=3365066 RepID=UPI0037A6594D
MGLKNIVVRAGMVGSAAVMAIGLFAGEANATSTNIDYWSTDSAPVRCSKALCLYYNSGAEGAIFYNGMAGADYLRYFSFWDDHTAGVNSSNGAGQEVDNNAASAENGSVNCGEAIYVNSAGYGDSNVLDPGRGGNLTSNLKNNEASLEPIVPSGSYCQ